MALKEYFPAELASRHPGTREVIVLEERHAEYRKGLERFLHEGRILVKVRHPNVVSVTDLFDENETAYLVMELVGGRSLRALLDHLGRVPEDRTEKLMEEAVAGLASVHAAGVCHLDIKPENIVVDDAGHVVLVDFGTARLAGQRHSASALTIDYAAPEVLAGGDVGPESDIYSLAFVLYELLGGERPPSALSRMSGEMRGWQVPTAFGRWREMLGIGLAIERAERPRDAMDWWVRRPKKTASSRTSACIRGKSSRTEAITPAPYAPVTPPTKGMEIRAPAPGAVSVAEIPQHTGQAVVFEGMVIESLRSDEAHVLKFAAGDLRSGFKVVISGPAVERWPGGSLELLRLKGRRVRVRGIVKRHPRWGHEIVVLHPTALVVIA